MKVKISTTIPNGEHRASHGRGHTIDAVMTVKRPTKKLAGLKRTIRKEEREESTR
jgi:hypothetical protein